MRLRAQLIGFTAGVIYALTCAFLFTVGERSSTALLEFVSLAMIVGTPLAVGVVTVCFASPQQAENRNFKLFGSWLSVIGWSAISIGLAWETLICVVMLLPVYLPLATIGSLIGAYVRANYCNKTNFGVTACFAVLPLLVGLIEFQVESPTKRHSVSSQIRIAAPTQAVWDVLPNIDSIQDRELPWTLSRALGIPKPRSASTESLSLGGVRQIVWDKGVQFEETITGLEQNRRLAYDVLADEQSMKIAGLDTHVVVGGEYFEVESGEYSLEADGDGTVLTLMTSYRIASNLNWYGSLWADYVLDDFHYSVLRVIHDRVESAQ